MKQELRMMATMTRDPKARKAAKAERTRAGKIIAHGIDKGCVEAASVLAFTTGMSLLPPYVCWINKLRQICGQRVAPMGYMAA